MLTWGRGRVGSSSDVARPCQAAPRKPCQHTVQLVSAQTQDKGEGDASGQDRLNSGRQDPKLGQEERRLATTTSNWAVVQKHLCKNWSLHAAQGDPHLKTKHGLEKTRLDLPAPFHNLLTLECSAVSGCCALGAVHISRGRCNGTRATYCSSLKSLKRGVQLDTRSQA